MPDIDLLDPLDRFVRGFFRDKQRGPAPTRSLKPAAPWSWSRSAMPDGAAVNRLQRASTAQIAELEKDSIYLEKLLDHRHIEDLQALAKDLAGKRRDLSRLLEQYQKAPDANTKAAIQQEIARLKERIGELMRRMRTGVPVVKKETVGRQGKIAGQPAHTREVKLGCVFTQTTWDKKGYPIRAPDSTTYTGAVESAEEFGRRLYREAGKRGGSRAQKQVVIGDGAEWIWNLAALHFSDALHIVDLYHARQHLWDLARQLYPNDDGKRKAWMKLHQKRLLDKGKIEKLVAALRAIPSSNPAIAKKIRTEADYFERNAQRMRYPQFRRQHLFVGSGVVEAGCKTVVASRLKRSGMFWTVPGANAILALRCAHLNGRFEDYWEGRRPAIAA